MSYLYMPQACISAQAKRNYYHTQTGQNIEADRFKNIPHCDLKQPLKTNTQRKKQGKRGQDSTASPY